MRYNGRNKVYNKETGKIHASEYENYTFKTWTHFNVFFSTQGEE